MGVDEDFQVGEGFGIKLRRKATQNLPASSKREALKSSKKVTCQLPTKKKSTKASVMILIFTMYDAFFICK